MRLGTTAILPLNSMIYIIGSGPAGVAAAQALLSSGQKVVMLDYGLTLEEEKAQRLAQLRRMPPEEWPHDFIASMKNTVPNRKGVGIKRIYGSDFPYRGFDWIDYPSDRVDVKGSLAKGGLSNSWGANSVPFVSSDIKDWPITLEDLVPHYKAVLGWIPFSATKDHLSNILPLYHENPEPLRLSRQASLFLKQLENHEPELASKGIYFGSSRLAVRAKSSNEGPGCVYCGLCLYGCPYGLIYTSAHTVDQLKSNSHFEYRPGATVVRLKEEADGVRIFFTPKSSNDLESVKADRVYVASGAISSAKILLTSLEAPDAELVLKDSQYFLLPFLSAEGVQNVSQEPLHTLCQALVQIQDSAISPFTINLELYTYNDFYKSIVENYLGPLRRVFQPLTEAFLGRLSVFQGYLHSHDSSALKIKLGKNGASNKLILTPLVNGATKTVLKKLGKKLKSHRGQFGGWPLSWFLTQQPIGKSYHYGGTFPMKKNPGPFESDLAGRPYGFKRVHLADASVFPSIPSTTFTLSVMANAHRIASMEASL